MGSVGKCPDELEDTGIDGIQQFLSFCHNWAVKKWSNTYVHTLPSLSLTQRVYGIFISLPFHSEYNRRAPLFKEGTRSHLRDT